MQLFLYCKKIFCFYCKENSINSIGDPLCSIMATLTSSDGGFGGVITLKSRLASSVSKFLDHL